MIGRTYTPRTFAADIIALVRTGPRLLSVYGQSRMDPALRERVMVAVSCTNACRQCTRVHETWALRSGVSADELQRLGAGELAAMPAEHRPAVTYATALAEGRFTSLSPDAQAIADAHLDRKLQRNIEAITRLITFANLSVNTAHAVARGARTGTAG